MPKNVARLLMLLLVLAIPLQAADAFADSLSAVGHHASADFDRNQPAGGVHCEAGDAQCTDASITTTMDNSSPHFPRDSIAIELRITPPQLLPQDLYRPPLAL
jgi:hypothetical protein